MPIRYVQTLAAVAGIVQLVNTVEITCSGRPAVQILARKQAGVTITAVKPTSFVITAKPTITTDYGGV